MTSPISSVPTGLKELDVALKGGFNKPANLLIIGAPLCGKREIGLCILNSGLERQEAAIYISTSQTAEETRSHWQEYGFRGNWEQEGRVKFVDCYSKMLGENISDTPSIRRIPSILDYTKLSVTVNELCSEFLLKNTGVRLLLDSLSSFLIYSSLQTVLRFLHIFLGQLRRQNVLGFYLLEEGAHDDTTFNHIKTFSNGAIKLDQGGRTLHLEGFLGINSTPIAYDDPRKTALNESQSSNSGEI
jgi:KaiC/GvpD/RAD55 family RecA-like ATPase